MNFHGYTYTKLGQDKIYERVVRSAMCLSEQDRLVLLFILDRTIGWRKLSETISEVEFIKGVFRRRNGRRLLVAKGTGLSPAQLTAALESLKNFGAIRSELYGKRLAYAIDEDWLHPDLDGLGMWAVNEDDYAYGDP